MLIIIIEVLDYIYHGNVLLRCLFQVDSIFAHSDSGIRASPVQDP